MKHQDSNLRRIAKFKRVALVSLAFTPFFANSQQYQITDLGSLGGGYSVAYDINNNGQIVGFSRVSNGVAGHGFIYSQQSGMIDLGTFGRQESNAYRINNNGDIAGWTNGTGPAFFLPSNGQVNFLAPDQADSQARGLNDNGQVVGFSSSFANSSPFVYKAFIYTAGSGLTEINPSWSSSVAYGVNNAGQIVGSAVFTSGSPNSQHAFVYTPGGSTIDLGTLGGPYALASSINDKGYVVGSSTVSALWDRYHAFIYSSSLGVVDIGCENCTAEDINNWNVVVGQDRAHGAFVFSLDGGVKYLKDFVLDGAEWTLSSANAVNDHGQIVGWGQIAGETHAYLLTPVPEPSSLILFQFGLLTLLLYSRGRISRCQKSRNAL